MGRVFVNVFTGEIQEQTTKRIRGEGWVKIGEKDHRYRPHYWTAASAKCHTCGIYHAVFQPFSRQLSDRQKRYLSRVEKYGCFAADILRQLESIYGWKWVSAREAEIAADPETFLEKLEKEVMVELPTSSPPTDLIFWNEEVDKDSTGVGLVKRFQNHFVHVAQPNGSYKHYLARVSTQETALVGENFSITVPNRIWNVPDATLWACGGRKGRDVIIAQS